MARPIGIGGERARRQFRGVAAPLALGAGLWLSASLAFAQDKKPAASAKLSATEAAKKQGPKRVLRLEGDVIEGKVTKPEAFYLLNRTSITFEGLKLETKMVPKILRQLRKPPF